MQELNDLNLKWRMGSTCIIVQTINLIRSGVCFDFKLNVIVFCCDFQLKGNLKMSGYRHLIQIVIVYSPQQMNPRRK